MKTSTLILIPISESVQYIQIEYRALLLFLSAFIDELLRFLFLNFYFLIATKKGYHVYNHYNSDATEKQNSNIKKKNTDALNEF